MTLSPKQLTAVTRTGQDVCVVAGPGSGKTRVLTERFAWLVEERGIPADRILAITFTEKAASEIKERLVRRFASHAERRASVERAWVSTIDGFCARLLQENAIAAGLPPGFRILDASRAAKLQRDSAERALDALYRDDPAEMRRLMEALDLTTIDYGYKPDLSGSLVETFETMRVSGVRLRLDRQEGPSSVPEAVSLAQEVRAAHLRGDGADRLNDWLSAFVTVASDPVSVRHIEVAASFDFNLNRLRHSSLSRLKKEVMPRVEAEWVAEYYRGLPALLERALARFEAEYRDSKRRIESLDFADLEEQAIALLEANAEIRAETQGHFDQVLMDELQDTNRLQWRLVNLVRKPEAFYAVGDINQSIYGFRHADPGVFAEYRDSVPEPDLLDDNYRSRDSILRAVDRALDGQPGIEPRALVAMGEFTPQAGPAVERIVGIGAGSDAGSGGDAESNEAAQVAARIAELVESGERRLGDIALLVRSWAAAEPFEEAFDRLAIPFMTAGGRTFLETREARDVLLLLAALANPLNDIALVGVLRGPLVGWAEEQFLAKSRKKWLAEFERRFGEARRLVGTAPPDRIVASILDQCGYLRRLPPRALANVEKLLAWLRREYAERPRSLAELYDDLTALRDLQGEAEAPPPEAANAVRILTIHASKGLEFPVVFLAALHRATDNSSPTLLFSKEGKLGARWRNAVSGEAVPDIVYLDAREARKRAESAEESRLLYVAMTRAQHRLILSHAEKSKRRSRWAELAAAAVPDVSIVSPRGKLVPLAAPSTDSTPRVAARPEVATAGPGQSGADSAVSATDVALFAADPQRYFSERYLGFEAPRIGPSTGATQLGIEVHRALAGLPTNSEEARALAAKFRSSELGRRAERATRVEREFDFLIDLDGTILSGQIDLWFEDRGELVVVDYKTGLDESSREAYELQLRLYALALERYLGKAPDLAVLAYLRSDTYVEVSLLPHQLDTAQASIATLRANQAESR